MTSLQNTKRSLIKSIESLPFELVHDTPRRRAILMRTPLRRFGRPEELVGVAVLLASDGVSFLTGQWIVVVDGGYLASSVNS